MHNSSGDDYFGRGELIVRQRRRGWMGRKSDRNDGNEDGRVGRGEGSVQLLGLGLGVIQRQR